MHICLWVRAGSGALAQLAAGVMQAEPPSAKHRLVALALLETYVRYWKVLQQAQQYIPQVRGWWAAHEGLRPCMCDARWW